MSKLEEYQGTVHFQPGCGNVPIAIFQPGMIIIHNGIQRYFIATLLAAKIDSDDKFEVYRQEMAGTGEHC